MKGTYRLLPLLMVLCFISTTAFSQSENFSYQGTTIEINQKMLDHYGQDYIQNLKSKNPDLLLYLNFYSTHAYKVEHLGEKLNASNIPSFNLKKLDRSNASDYDPLHPEQFNVLAYSPTLKENQQVFKTGNGDQGIVLLSKKSFLKAFNEYKSSFLK